MKRILIILLIISLCASIIALSPSPNTSDKKITICHIPPGNKDNPQTIDISENAWPAHEAHGDYLGACLMPTSTPKPPTATYTLDPPTVTPETPTATLEPTSTFGPTSTLQTLPTTFPCPIGQCRGGSG